MLRRLLWLGALGLTLSLPISACSRNSVLADEETSGPRAPGFGEADSGGEAEVVETPMCAVTTCPASYATCPSSEFPCDVNLLKDDDNCGQCGVRCGGPNIQFSQWSCVDGQCAFSCSSQYYRNCDENPTNGCESDVSSDSENCGVCGNVCPPGKTCREGHCLTKCEPLAECGENCVDLESDDYNCGACGNVCDPSGPGLPPLHESMYYGCGDGECGKAKCRDPMSRNCNSDPQDGCETPIWTHENCSSCGDTCTENQICADVFFGLIYRCQCAPGESLCMDQCAGSNCLARCVRTQDDPDNCGGCDRVCPGRGRPHYAPSCSMGVCGGQCDVGYADCDGVGDNGCEVVTRVDNRNCGACGVACEPNQVCSEGKCLVAPCETEGQAGR